MPRSAIVVEIFVDATAMGLGHQHPDALPDYVLRQVAEELLCRPVERLDDAAFVNDGDGVDGSVNGRAVFRLVRQPLCLGELPVVDISTIAIRYAGTPFASRASDAVTFTQIEWPSLRR